MALTTVTVSGHYVNPDGTNATGQVKFKLNQDLQDAAGNIIVPRTDIIVPLVNGAFSKVLYATDDSTTAPTGATYRVTEEIVGDGVAPPYDIQIPNASAVLDLADVAPTVQQASFSYTLLSTFSAHAADPTAHSGGGGTYPVLLQAPTDVVTLIVQGRAAGQTADITQWKSPAGTTLINITAGGNFVSTAGIITSGAAGVRSGFFYDTTDTGPYFQTASGGWTLANRTAIGNIPLKVQGMASQSGDLQRWIDSGSTILAKVQADGGFQAATGKFQVDSVGRLGLLGAAVNAGYAVHASFTHPGTATTLYGVVMQPIYPATTTAVAGNYQSFVQTVAASFTLGTAYGFLAQGGSAGAGSTITNLVGFRADNHGGANITNAYGLQIGAQSGATTLNVAARLDGGTNANLWLNSDTAGIGGGITFGTARDTSLYRAGSNSLGTGGSILATGEVRANNGAGSQIRLVELGSGTQPSLLFAGTGFQIGTSFFLDSSGRIGVDGAIDTRFMLTILNAAAHPSNNTNIYGGVLDMLAPSTATAAVTGWYSNLRTASASFTVSSVYHFFAEGPMTLGASSAVTNVYGFLARNQGRAGITNAYGLWIDAQSGAANTNLPLVINAAGAGGMTVDSSGRTGIGVTANTSQMIYILGGNTHPGTATTVDGVLADVRFAATATVAGNVFRARVNTVASAFTLADSAAFMALTPGTIGAGSAITRNYGLYVQNQGIAGVTTAYGVWIEAVTGATNNRPLVVGSLATFMVNNSGQVGILSQVADSAADRCISIGNTATHPGAQSSLYGIVVNPNVPATNTSVWHGYYSQTRTTGSSFTLSDARTYYAAPPAINSPSVVTSNHGMYIDNMGTTGITNAYGLRIIAQANASTLNVGARIDTGTTCALWLGGDQAGTTGASGIHFGSGHDAVIYRSGTSELQINGAHPVDTVGRIALGASINSSVMLKILNANAHVSSSTTIFGIDNDYTIPATATVSAYGMRSRLRTAASAFTVTDVYVNMIDSNVLGAGSAVTNWYGIQIVNQGNAAIANAYGLWISAQSGATTTNLPFVINSTTTFAIDSSGRVGQGIAPQLNSLYYMQTTAHPGTGTAVTGFTIDVRGQSTATAGVTGLKATVRSAAAAYTLATAYGVDATQPVVGAASTITTAIGFHAGNQGISGVTNAYGLWIDAQSGAATDNLAIVIAGTSTWAVDSSGRMGVSSAVRTDTMISVLNTANHPSTGANVYGIMVRPSFASTVTGSGVGLYVQTNTAAASFTQTEAIALYVAQPSYGAGSTVTNAIGLYVQRQTSATGSIGTAYGAYINGQSLATSINVGVRIDSSTQGALWLGGDAAGTDLTGGIVFGTSRDISLFRSSATTLMSNAALATRRNTIPADADLSAGDMSIWFDKTNGASKLMVKAKQADGTVKTASLALA